MNDNQKIIGICDCGFCFDAEYPKEFGKVIVPVCKKCHKIVIEDGICIL